MERFSVPLEVPGGRSLRAVAIEMRAQTVECYLLAHPSDAQEVRTAALFPAKGCSY